MKSKPEARQIPMAKDGSLEAAVLQYRFVSDQAKKFEEERQRLSEFIKGQLPVGEPRLIAGFNVSVSEYQERRFKPMAEAEKLVSQEIMAVLTNSFTKSRLNVK